MWMEFRCINDVIDFTHYTDQRGNVTSIPSDTRKPTTSARLLFLLQKGILSSVDVFKSPENAIGLLVAEIDETRLLACVIKDRLLQYVDYVKQLCVEIVEELHNILELYHALSGMADHTNLDATLTMNLFDDFMDRVSLISIQIPLLNTWTCWASRLKDWLAASRGGADTDRTGTGHVTQQHAHQTSHPSTSTRRAEAEHGDQWMDGTKTNSIYTQIPGTPGQASIQLPNAKRSYRAVQQKMQYWRD
ncbi:hypothetical protein A0H81_06882 [Grifola frondosa]|uniref:Uncharacterized protein n=1 Tax=Grifola frondosa TaxID=5627 RepID=A0A1C7M7M5_GRIFR|nr:hypothetical protein A0H81_06882 [Grifola frondosa]